MIDPLILEGAVRWLLVVGVIFTLGAVYFAAVGGGKAHGPRDESDPFPPTETGVAYVCGFVAAFAFILALVCGALTWSF